MKSIMTTKTFIAIFILLDLLQLFIGPSSVEFFRANWGILHPEDSHWKFKANFSIIAVNHDVH